MVERFGDDLFDRAVLLGIVVETSRLKRFCRGHIDSWSHWTGLKGACGRARVDRLLVAPLNEQAGPGCRPRNVSSSVRSNNLAVDEPTEFGKLRSEIGVRHRKRTTGNVFSWAAHKLANNVGGGIAGLVVAGPEPIDGRCRSLGHHACSGQDSSHDADMPLAAGEPFIVIVRYETRFGPTELGRLPLVSKDVNSAASGASSGAAGLSVMLISSVAATTSPSPSTISTGRLNRTGSVLWTPRRSRRSRSPRWRSLARDEGAPAHCTSRQRSSRLLTSPS